MRVPASSGPPDAFRRARSAGNWPATMDLLPTFAKLAGAEAPGDRAIDGRDSSIAPRRVREGRSGQNLLLLLPDPLQAVGKALGSSPAPAREPPAGSDSSRRTDTSIQGMMARSKQPLLFNLDQDIGRNKQPRDRESRNRETPAGTRGISTGGHRRP